MSRHIVLTSPDSSDEFDCSSLIRIGKFVSMLFPKHFVIEVFEPAHTDLVIEYAGKIEQQKRRLQEKRLVFSLSLALTYGTFFARSFMLVPESIVLGEFWQDTFAQLYRSFFGTFSRYLYSVSIMGIGWCSYRALISLYISRSEDTTALWWYRPDFYNRFWLSDSLGLEMCIIAVYASLILICVFGIVYVIWINWRTDKIRAIAKSKRSGHSRDIAAAN